MSQPARGVVFFDVDGTLVPRTSTCQHLARHLGHLAEIAAAEAAYAAGTMTNREASVIDAIAWRGHTEAEITAWLHDLPLIDGIAETLVWCRAHNLRPYLATLAWEPVGRYLARRFGFAGSSGPSLVVLDGRYTGEVKRHFDEYDKATVATATAAAAGLLMPACAAIGDSRSDLPLFAAVGLAIAFNASPAARAAATHTVDGTDLTAVVPYLRNWLERHGRLAS
jgi:phosphoserine phosphatase